MKRLPLAGHGALVAAMVLAPSPARADELAPEVQACLAAYPGAVLAGQETPGPDVVCLAFTEGVPGNSSWDDTYVWYTPPLSGALPPPPVTDPAVVEAPVSATALAVPQDVEVSVVTDSLARASRVTAKVTYDAVKRARSYVVKCGDTRARTERLRAKVSARVGDACKVRARNASGLGDWSKKVRISG